MKSRDKVYIIELYTIICNGVKFIIIYNPIRVFIPCLKLNIIFASMQVVHSSVVDMNYKVCLESVLFPLIRAVDTPEEYGHGFVC